MENSAWTSLGSLVVQAGFAGFMAWYLLTKALPAMQDKFTVTLKEQRDDYARATKEQREDYAKSVDRERESVTAVTRLVDKQEADMLHKVLDIVQQNSTRMADIQRELTALSGKLNAGK